MSFVDLFSSCTSAEGCGCDHNSAAAMFDARLAVLQGEKKAGAANRGQHQ